MRDHGTFRYVFGVLIRSRLTGLLIGTGAALILGSCILTYLTPGTERRTFFDAAYLGLELLAILGPLLGSMFLQALEFEQRTIWLVLVRPPTRPAYTRGRWAGLTGASGIAIAACGALLGVMMLAIRAFPEPWFMPVVVAALLESALLAAMACAVASITTTSLTAILVDFGIVVLGYLSAILPALALKTPMASLKLLLWGTYWLLPHLSLFAVRELADAPESWYLAWLGGYSILYSAAALTLAAWLLHRREV